MIQPEFIGRLHPVVLHLPIGLLAALFIIEGLALCLRSDARELRLCRKTLTAFFALSAVVSAITGYMLSLEHTSGGVLLKRHMWLGISVAVLATALSGLTFRRGPTFERRAGSILRLLVLLGLGPVVAVTGHLGGQLTHGSGFLSAYAPAFLKPLLGPPEPALPPAPSEPTVTVFAGLIQPILDNHCIMCHGQDRRSARLDLHTAEGVLTGSRDGPVIIPGKAQDSELIKRITLPLDQDGHMPPEGKAQLSQVHIDALKWWVDSGAPVDANLDTNALPQELRKLMPGAAPEAQAQTALSGQLDDTLVRNLIDKQISVQRIEQNQPWLWISFPAITDQVTDDTVKELLPLAPYIAWLDLSNTRITSKALEWIGQMPALEELNLRQTAVESHALNALVQLKHLERLNLSQVPVDDSIVDSLLSMPKLKRVYLGGTKVSPAGIQRLSAPRIEVITGVRPAEVISAAPEDAASTE